MRSRVRAGRIGRAAPRRSGFVREGKEHDGMTYQATTSFAAQHAGGIRSPHVGECTPMLAMNGQDDCGRVSAAGDR